MRAYIQVWLELHSKYGPQICLDMDSVWPSAFLVHKYVTCSWHASYWGWKKSCTTLDGWNPINSGINSSTGAAFLPPTLLATLRTQMKDSCELTFSHRPPARSTGWRPRRKFGIGGSRKMWCRDAIKTYQNQRWPDDLLLNWWYHPPKHRDWPESPQGQADDWGGMTIISFWELQDQHVLLVFLKGW